MTARRRDSWLVAYELTVCFDTDLGRTRYDYVGTSARCELCGDRVAIGVNAQEALVEHSRTHERDVTQEDGVLSSTAPQQKGGTMA